MGGRGFEGGFLFGICPGRRGSWDLGSWYILGTMWRYGVGQSRCVGWVILEKLMKEE